MEDVTKETGSEPAPSESSKCQLWQGARPLFHTGRETVWNGIWFFTCLFASSVWCIDAASQLGATLDEPIYLPSGLDYWHTGSHSKLMHFGTMPLPIDVETLPLFLWERWHGARFDLDRDTERLLPWARAGTL